MSQVAQNQYADDDRTWNTTVSCPEEVIEAYMDMQERVLSENAGRSSAQVQYLTALYSDSASDLQEAYSAGYEQADRCQAVFGTMTFNTHNPIGIRSSTGIRFAVGVANNAFTAGFNARVNA
jgi:hypothetical protein